METNNPLLIVLDPSHGGSDTGAQSNGRSEKEDVLRLALAIRDVLHQQGVYTLLTREGDDAVPLENRVQSAVQNTADLLICLHRRGAQPQDHTTKGVAGFISLTAPEATAATAAQHILTQLAEVGVQENLGVHRSNAFILRRSPIPAVLLEMGSMIDEEDNRLFDQNLTGYAEAITRAILQYFGLYMPPAVIPELPAAAVSPPTVPPAPPAQKPAPQKPMPAPPKPSSPNQSIYRTERIKEAQTALNATWGAGLAVDGLYGPASKKAAIRALQTEINRSAHAGLAVDGIMGPKTQDALPTIREGDRGGLVSVLQILLKFNGYHPGNIDGIYGPRTKTAVTIFQRDNFLIPDGIAGPRTFSYLLR